MSKYGKTPRNLLAAMPLAAIPLAIAIACAASSCGGSGDAATGPRAPDAVRGRYLVERVGMCQDCHSPRDETGAYVAERWLTGAPLPFTPTVPMPWAPASKPIAGLPTLDDDQALTFLTRGVLPSGRPALPPMPEYRFSPEDARDIIAYLRKPIAPEAATHVGDAGAR